MSRHRVLATLSVAVILVGAGTVVARSGGGEGHAPAIGIPSSEFWSQQLYPKQTLGPRDDADADHDSDTDADADGDADSDGGGGDPDAGPGMIPVSNVLYQGNTDERFLHLTSQAAKLASTGAAWRSVGPFHGVADILGVGSGAEELGKVGGIGTAMAVDPNDKSGNTVYLGTIGGLYKSTNGGKTVRNITEGKIAREAVGAVAIDPHNPKLLYLGTGVSIFTLSDDAAGTGVYVSRNGGKTWHHPAANVHGYGTNAIAVDPKNGDVFVGTTYGLWRSTDRGRSFHRVHLPDHAKYGLGNWLASIAINPFDPRELTVDVGYAFGKKLYGGKVLAPGNGLYRSNNYGRTFTYMASNKQLTQPLASKDPLGRISVAYSPAPGGKNIMWALVQDAGRAAGDHITIDTPVLPVSVDGNSELNGLFRSNDDGKSWALQSDAQTLTTALGTTNGLAEYPLGYAEGVQADYNNWVLADGKDPNRVYLGLEEAFTGEYHGTTATNLPLLSTFTAIEKYANICGFLTYFNTIPNSNGIACPSVLPEYGGGTTHPDQHSAAIAVTAQGERLYSGNDGGWWAQNTHAVTDTTGVLYPGFNNSTWTSLNAPATVLPWDVTRLQDGSYLLALQDNGVAHVMPNGRAYQVCGGDGVYVFPGANAHSYYCGIDGQTILGTTDDFKHTINVTPQDNQTGATFLSPWAVDRTNPNHLIAAAGNVDETTAGMKSNTYDPTYEELLSSTWKTVYTPPKPPNGPWDSTAVSTRGKVSYVAMCSVCRPSLATDSASKPTTVISKIVTNVKPHCAAGLASSACWHMAASKGLPHQQISEIAVDPHNPETIYVGLRQLIVMGASDKATGSQKVMVSHDGGNTFHDLSGNLPRADVHRLILRAGRLYAATDVGVFTAKLGSRHWERFGTGLPEVTFRSMSLSADGKHLVLGAYGRGVWDYAFKH
ncbi:MAG TPA: hypothetical protein VHV76_13810 [Mycobacteriales bacterium]|nr:hypothetical protein [Mycobacteriales bacterium]